MREGLRRLGHDVYVFAPGFSGYKDVNEHIYRFRSVNLTSKVKYPLAIPFSRRLFPLIPRLRLDVIHTHHPFILGEVGAHFAKKLGIPLVYTFHTQFEQYAHYIPFNQDFVKMMAKQSVIAYARKCDLIICPSPQIIELLNSYGITERIEMLQNAIDLEPFAKGDGDAVRRHHGLSREDKLLIYVGRMGIEKNLGFMLQAFRNVAREVPQAKLMLVGEGPELGALRDLAGSLGVGDKVIFPGRIPYERIPDYYAASCLFVMTSTTEVKPLALLEALASSLPVVAVNACGTGDTLTHGVDGILTDLDVNAFSTEIMALLRNDDRLTALGEGAKATASKYSIHTTTERLVNLYQNLRHGSAGVDYSQSGGK
jgi:glycosyltransferase involved in cell wall biosynthesis